jgi:hypothetical protein
MKNLRFGNAGAADARLVRAMAVTFIGAMAVLALYFGQDVLITAAIAVLTGC